MGLDKSLDELRDKILGTKPLPSLREVVSDVCRQESQKRANNPTQNSNSSTLHEAKSSSSYWIVDSGASDHMTGDRLLFTTYFSCNNLQTMCIANGTCTKVVGIGSICLSNTLTLKSVLFVPKLDYNLIYVSKLNRDLNYETKFLYKSCIYQDLSFERTIGNVSFHVSIYALDCQHSFNPFCQSSVSIES
ncbi:hypothetical protein V6Z12_D12G030600 [Gossypium hirsutum]